MPLSPPSSYRKTAYIHRTGVLADRPAAADVLAGTLYFATDTTEVYRSTGVAWEDYSSGQWQDVSFDAGDYTASTGTWTVASGDVLVNRYTIIGRTMIWSFQVTATVASNNTNLLNIALPAGATIGPANAQGFGRIFIGGTWVLIDVGGNSGDGHISLYNADGTQIPADAALGAFFTIAFEIL